MLWQDLRHAVRRLYKDRSLTFMAVAALSLGIGANSTVFTFVNAVLIRGLPFEEPDEIMHLATRLVSEGQNRGVSYPNFVDWREQTTTFTDLAAFAGGTANLSDNDHAPERVTGFLVSANTFRLLRQPVLLGRDFLPEESERGADRVVILGYEVWQNRYGGDPDVIGRMLRVNEEPSTIVGVMPEACSFRRTPTHGDRCNLRMTWTTETAEDSGSLGGWPLGPTARPRRRSSTPSPAA